jgi:hypothetical protein
MKFICAQPAIEYYTWQVEVMINNFIEKGVNPNDIEIVSAHYGTVPESWSKLANKYNSVRFFFYKDTRFKPKYISSVRPHILTKHWLKFPELANETIFYHDCDIIFSKTIDFQKFIGDDISYLSDTISYIGANYIRSKGEHYLDLMTDLVGIDKQTVIDREVSSGGAQYLIKNVDAQYWGKVYHDSEVLFHVITKQIAKDKPPHALQIWCADMWAVLWNLWLLGKETKISSDLSFSWGTSSIDQWDKHNIYHNAGVTVERKDLFFKGAYQTKLPYDVKLESFNSKFCVYKYVEEILKTAEKSCLL